jgi:DNA-binding NarL/FixJ family response regulator
LAFERQPLPLEIEIQDAPIAIMLVDDNQLAAEALERWLLTVPGMRWIGWAADGPTAKAMVAERTPDVVLLDVEIPGTDTFELLRHLNQDFPQLRVVMFSAYVRAEYIDRALGDGAAGYIFKDEPLPVIADILRRAGAGECVLSPAAMAAMLSGG